MSGVKKHLSTPLLVTTCYTPDIPPYIILLGYHYHFYIFLNPLATTLTSLFPCYTPFTYCSTLWLPLIHPFSPTTPLLHIFEPFGCHSYIPFLLYYTPLTYCLTYLKSFFTGPQDPSLCRPDTQQNHLH